jgi:hypothetical protein
MSSNDFSRCLTFVISHHSLISVIVFFSLCSYTSFFSSYFFSLCSYTPFFSSHFFAHTGVCNLSSAVTHCSTERPSVPYVVLDRTLLNTCEYCLSIQRNFNSLTGNESPWSLCAIDFCMASLATYVKCEHIWLDYRIRLNWIVWYTNTETATCSFSLHEQSI